MPEGNRVAQRFKEIAADLKAMAEGVVAAAPGDKAPPKTPPPAEAEVNLPLAASGNDRARALVDLDKKFVVEAAAMPPAVSSYFRRWSFLTPEVCRTWRAGYLPRDGGDDKSGGTMRGRIVFPYHAEDGQLLTWFGLDAEHAEKLRQWETTDKSEPRPEPYRFIKGYRRGIELFGQHRLREEAVATKAKDVGLVVVNDPAGVMRLDTLGVPAVGLCGTLITREQAMKAARLARETAGGIVTVLLDCDGEGEQGMRQALGYLAQLTPVRLAWSGKMYGGKHQGRAVDSLTNDEWAEVATYLASGKAEGWSLR